MTSSAVAANSPQAKPEPRLEAPIRQTLAELAPYLWPPGRRDLRLRVVVALVALVIAKIGTAWVPLVFGAAVDALSAAPNPAGGAAPLPVAAIPVGLILSYGLARILGFGFVQVRDAVFARVDAHCGRQASAEVFRHLHSLSLGYHLGRQTGGLTRIIARGVAGMGSLLRIGLFTLLPTAIELLLTSAILAVVLDWSFAAVTLLTVILYVLFTIKVSDLRIRIRREVNDTDNAVTTRAVDSLLNIETVKAYTNEGFESRRYDESLAKLERANIRSQVSLSGLNLGQTVIVSLGLTAVMAMAAQGIVSGQLTPGDFVLVNTYLIQLAQPLGVFGFVYREVRQALVDLEQMFALGREKAEIADLPGAPALQIRGGGIRVEGLSFRYDSSRPILQDLSFEIAPGRSVAVVGPSGSGKSTLTRLLFRFYDPQAGRILIDGQDIRQVRQHSLRAALGLVPQDTALFNETLGFNIGYGRPEASTAEILSAADRAQLGDFIRRLPAGLDTMVGERGLKLSGGERQRVAIARAILKDPPILIFDEATSALDTATEREIQSSLGELARTRTTLIIAHRLSTVVDADLILVLERGRIVESGAHGLLLGQGGLYAQMWAAQAHAEAPDPHVEPVRQ